MGLTPEMSSFTTSDANGSSLRMFLHTIKWAPSKLARLEYIFCTQQNNLAYQVLAKVDDRYSKSKVWTVLEEPPDI